MKKMLVVLMVLSMATIASAALHVTGAPATLVVGNSATLALATDSPVAFGDGDWAGLAIVADVTMGSFSGGVSNDPLEPGMTVFKNCTELGFFPPTFPGEDGIAFLLAITGAGEPIGDLFTGINYTALAPGLATLTLWGSQDYVAFTNLGSVSIEQVVPEPFTMGLLGLGAMFLRRRSK